MPDSEAARQLTRHFEQMPNIPPSFVEEAIIDLLVAVYMKHSSEEDPAWPIAFHESPTGKALPRRAAARHPKSLKLGACTSRR